MGGICLYNLQSWLMQDDDVKMDLRIGFEEDGFINLSQDRVSSVVAVITVVNRGSFIKGGAFD